MKGKIMILNNHQMRAVELMIEQQERLSNLAKRQPKIPMDQTVSWFYEYGRGGIFETIILDKIAKLLAPESKEDLNLYVEI